MMCGDRWLETGSPWEGDEMTEREQFEAWARQSDTCPLLNRADHNGTELDEYHFPLARAMWEAWQAARATPALPQVPEGMAIVQVEFIHVLQDAPEINPSNYDHDQVCRLNTAVNEALAMLTVAKEKS